MLLTEGRTPTALGVEHLSMGSLHGDHLLEFAAGKDQVLKSLQGGEITAGSQQMMTFRDRFDGLGPLKGRANEYPVRATVWQVKCFGSSSPPFEWRIPRAGASDLSLRIIGLHRKARQTQGDQALRQLSGTRTNIDDYARRGVEARMDKHGSEH